MPLTTKKQKIEWLLNNQNLWEGFPWTDSEDQYSKIKELQKKFKTACYSNTTAYCDISMHRWIDIARKERRG